jgi:hypothetical protein
MPRPSLVAELTSRQRAVIVSLTAGKTHVQSANDAGVNPRTVQRWLVQAAFNAELRRAQDSMFGDALSRLARAAAPAVSIVGNLMADPQVPTHLRLKAAQIIMTHSLAMRDDDVVRRLTAIESKLGLATSRTNAA